MTAHANTYFLVPGWNFPAESVELGSIITNPTQPQLALFKPSAGDIDSPVHTTERAEFVSTADAGGSASQGLFGTFLGLFGLGDEPGLQYNRGGVLSYSFRHLRTQRFTPSEALKRRAVAEEDGRVAQFCRASGYSAPLYMVSGLKTVRGAGVTTASSRGHGWRISLALGVEAALANHHDHDHDDDAEGGPAPAVFAFELTEIRPSSAADGEIATSRFMGNGSGSGGELQSKLDAEFGDATFTVLGGFDEEDGSPCTIIASSPACVDLLTASSARIDPSRLHGARK